MEFHCSPGVFTTCKLRFLGENGDRYLFISSPWKPPLIGSGIALHRQSLVAHFAMPNVATWLREKDKKWFRPFFARHPDIRLWNALESEVPFQKIDGLLLTGGSDIAPEFLRQPIIDPTVLEKEVDPLRDQWEFEAVGNVLPRGLPIFAICKGLQVFNVALGGTLKLDVPGHRLPEMRDQDVQPLRNERKARHRFEKVNSSHHQAIDRLGDNCEVEAWCIADDNIEQIRLRNYPFALAVQYHPERGTIYDQLFEDFFSQLGNSSKP